MKFPTIEEMAKDVAEEAIDRYEYKGKTIRQWIDMLLNEDVVEVVRCKDCKYFSEFHHCGVLGFCEPNEYCSRGERRKEDAEIH